MKTPLCLFAIVLLVAAGLQAQSTPLVWSAEFRLRSEIDGRDLRNNTAPNIYTLARSRIGLSARPADHLTVFMQIQDSRVFGEEASTMTNLANVDMHQAWLEVGDIVPGLSVKAGKMEVSIGNGRLIQNNAFTNVGRTFTGIIGTYAFGHHTMHALLFNTRESATPPTSASKFGYVRDTGDLLAGAVFSTDAIAGHHLDLIALHHRSSKRDALNRDSLAVISLGGYLKGATGAFSYESDGAIQTGSMFGTDVWAYNLGGLLTYGTGGSTFTSATVALDVYSGQTISASTFGVFDPRFGAGHKFLGFMDYFTAIPAHTAGRGIFDVYARVELVWSTSFASQITVHNFQLMRTLSVAVPSRDLGQEANVVTRWRHSVPFSVELGVAAFLPGRAMRAMIGGSDPGLWVYISPQVNF